MEYQNSQVVVDYWKTPPSQITTSKSNAAASAALEIKECHNRLRSGHLALFHEQPDSRKVAEALRHALASPNPPALQAAIECLVERERCDLIIHVLFALASDIAEGAIYPLIHALNRCKNDSAVLWAYAKALRVRREWANADLPISAFISFGDFAGGRSRFGDSADIADGLTLSALLGDITDPNIGGSQDLALILEMAKTGHLGIRGPESILGFSLRQLRSAATSKNIGRKQLADLEALLTGGISSLTMPTDTSDPNYDKLVEKSKKTQNFAEVHKGFIRTNVKNFFSRMTPKQLSALREPTFDALNRTAKYLSDNYNEADLINPNSDLNYTEVISADIKNWLNTAITGINKPSAAAMRDAMNPEIARKLRIKIN